MRRLWMAGFIAAALLGLSYARQRSGDPADLVLIDGQVLTVDAADTVAQAVAITKGVIVAVGSNAEVRSRIGPSTRVIDLGGRSVTPGLIDSHVHFNMPSADLVDLGDEDVRSMKDVLDRAAARVKNARPGEWIRGVGWDEGKLAERRYITASDLDTVSPGNPVWLTHTTNHYGVGNSAALKLAGITRDTRDPPAGTIDRDAKGNPTGVLKESAQQLVTSRIPPLSVGQQKQGIAVWEQDLIRAPVNVLKDLKCVLTLLNGNIVYRDTQRLP
jgi:predicted amidohydrolase YtcJ